MYRFVSIVLLGVIAGAASAADPDAALRRVADRYVAAMLAHDPLLAYAYDLPAARHDAFGPLDAHARRRHERRLDALQRALQRIDPATLREAPARRAYLQLSEALDAQHALRVCRLPLWSPLNHMSGWHLGLADAAAQQPVAQGAQRRQALTRWRALPAQVQAMIANLREGLAQGRAVPRRVVLRVLAQMDGLAGPEARDDTWRSPGLRSGDVSFDARFSRVVDEAVLPALRAYRDFLRDEYLPRARDSLSLRALPDGARCYEAFLRFHTTLPIAPDALLAAGRAEIARNEAALAQIGRERFGTEAFDALAALPGAAADNRFAAEADALAFARDTVARARVRSAALFPRLPETACTVEPPPPHERGSGRSSHYEPPSGARRHGVYRINAEQWRTDLRSSAEITAVHETWPGHHLQMTWLEAEPWPVSVLTESSAFIEGWGRYAEALGEEAGIYREPHTALALRVWPARGLVTDIGVHWSGWSTDEARRFLLATGRYTEASADAALDRVAALPGQWTAYDTGAMQIRRLRAEAEAALGDAFSLPAFHDALLSQGVLPLDALNDAMQTWIQRQREVRD